MRRNGEKGRKRGRETVSGGRWENFNFFFGRLAFSAFPGEQENTSSRARRLGGSRRGVILLPCSSRVQKGRDKVREKEPAPSVTGPIAHL